MNIKIRVEEFLVQNAKGEIFEAITEQEFEKTDSQLKPLLERTYCLVPITSDNDDNHISVENEKDINYKTMFNKDNTCSFYLYCRMHQFEREY